MLLHEWFYDLCSRVCHDREYLFLFFFTHFQAAIEEITHQGRTVSTGTYTLPGRKSEWKVMLRWSLSRRIDWTAPNVLRIDWQLQDRSSSVTLEEGNQHFALATGEPVPDPIDVGER